jgi:hypothetical protein
MMTLLLTYRGICALVAILVACVVVRRRSLGLQVTGALVMVPLLLRLFLVK